MIFRLFARASSSQACIAVSRDSTALSKRDSSAKGPDLFRTKSHVGQEVPDKEGASKDKEHDTKHLNLETVDLLQHAVHISSVSPLTCKRCSICLYLHVMLKAKSGRLSWTAAPEMDPEVPSASETDRHLDS